MSNRREARLRQTFRQMSSELLAARAQDPQLAPLARRIAQEEHALRQRGETVAPAPAGRARPVSHRGHLIVSIGGCVLVILVALLFRQGLLAAVAFCSMLVLLARLLPILGLAAGGLLLLNPLWVWSEGGFATGHPFVSIMIGFFSILIAGLGLGMIGAALRPESTQRLRRPPSAP